MLAKVIFYALNIICVVATFVHLFRFDTLNVLKYFSLNVMVWKAMKNDILPADDLQL